ncbi:MAG: hypothetical protein ACI4TW_05555 [Prevotella sp.]
MAGGLYLTLCLSASGILSSCSKDEEQYTKEYICQFSFSTQLHPTSLLTLALANPASYVKVDVKTVSGTRRLDISSNNGKDTESITVSTDKENYMIGTVGANSSIIVGCSTFNGLKAYDSQCPNCLNDYTGNSYPLTWTSNGQAVECGKCGRKYELNYEGSTDNGKMLLQYKVDYNGTLLSVHN